MRDDIHKRLQESLVDCNYTLNVSYKINFTCIIYIITFLPG